MNDLKHKLTCLISGMDGEPKKLGDLVHRSSGEHKLVNQDEVDKWNTASEQAEKIIEEIKPLIKEAYSQGLNDSSKVDNDSHFKFSGEKYLSTLNL